jgi:hypothetical protein
MKILLVADNFQDGIAFYRSVGPWNQLEKNYDHYNLSVTKFPAHETFRWDIFSAHDVMVISNPRNKKHYDTIMAARNFGITVWADYDDCYVDIPEENQSFNILTAGHVNQLTKDCLMACDVVTVTTNYLKNVFLPFNSNIKVIPNGFPLEMVTEKSLGEITQGTQNFVSWRGSTSHIVNLDEYSEQIIEVAKNNSEWTFNFFGMNVAPIFRKQFNYGHYGFANLVDSFYRMKQMSSKIQIVTLYERPFNLSKSNIAWIEATIAGSVVLAPDWEEWQKPGIVNYSSKEDFKVKLQALLNGEYDLKAHFEKSRDYIFENLSLKKVNKERLKILQSLCVAGKDNQA